MIDLGAHGMYLIHWLLGMPVSAASTFTVCCQNPDTVATNKDMVEDNAVTVMNFEDGAIAINETGFVSGGSPVVFEAHGELGSVRMENERVYKRSKATDGKSVEVELGDALPSPIQQFLDGKPLPGCGIEEAKALTRMMEMAYRA